MCVYVYICTMGIFFHFKISLEKIMCMYTHTHAYIYVAFRYGC